MGLILIDAESHAWEMISNDQGFQSYKIPLLTLQQNNKRFKRSVWWGNLPVELIANIMTYQVDYLLQQANFKDALIHILRYEPLLSKYYKRYVGIPIEKGEDVLVSVDVVKRVRLENVFDFVDWIFNDSLLRHNGLNTSTFYFDVAANCQDFSNENYEPHKIISKFGLSLLDLNDFNRLNEPFDLLTVQQGQRYIDTIWFNAERQENVALLEYETMERPVIVLAITDSHLNLLRYHQVKQSIGWMKLIRLFHLVGGPQTAVYICDSMEDQEYFIKKIKI